MFFTKKKKSFIYPYHFFLGRFIFLSSWVYLYLVVIVSGSDSSRYLKYFCSTSWMYFKCKEKKNMTKRTMRTIVGCNCLAEVVFHFQFFQLRFPNDDSYCATMTDACRRGKIVSEWSHILSEVYC